jgi:hypothetical protein
MKPYLKLKNSLEKAEKSACPLDSREIKTINLNKRNEI